MKTHCERPYQAMVTAAATLHNLPQDALDRHVRRLAIELADAVRDLDSRLRAGLTPPRPWQPAMPATTQSPVPEGADTDNEPAQTDEHAEVGSHPNRWTTDTNAHRVIDTDPYDD